jgi:hypothetical protein
MEEIICSVCHGNGIIEQFIIIDTNQTIFLCDECESCWREEDQIALEKYFLLSDFLLDMDYSRLQKVLD